MSDIDLSNLDWIIWTFVVVCFVGPPLVLGGIFLLLGIFVRQKKVLLAAYLVTSTAVSTGIMLWLSDWQPWPVFGTWAFPIGLGMAAGCFGLYLILLWAIRKAFGKKLAPGEPE